MFSRVSEFVRRHPALRDALLWVIPALLFGGLLRWALLHYFPYAYWGSDSRSYFDFTYKLYGEGFVSLVQKRRFLYPIFVAVVSALPGAPLKWLAWVQHGFGLLTLIPLAYVVRKNFTLWRWWVIPVTVAYAGFPVILWYEHELLGETLFFAMVLWAFAGWTAWVGEPRRARAQRLFWLFFIPFALFILTKPSGRFLWPGLIIGLVSVFAWRRLARVQWAALAGLAVVTLFVGDKSQGAWLLYVASYPLTQTETAPYAEYKAEIRDMVQKYRTDLDTYHEHDDEPFAFLENPAKPPDKVMRPHWVPLAKNQELRRKLYMSLALEGIKAEPLNFLLLGIHRIAGSINISEFKEKRFDAGNYAERFRDDYDAAQARLSQGKPNALPLALGYSAKGPLPPYDELAQRLSPAPQSWAASFVPQWVAHYQAHADFVALPKNNQMEQARLTPLGYWLALSILLVLVVPFYRPALGVWTVAVLGYLMGVFLVSQVNPRYFGAAWPVLIPLLVVPLDLLASLLLRRRPAVSTGRTIAVEDRAG